MPSKQGSSGRAAPPRRVGEARVRLSDVEIVLDDTMSAEELAELYTPHWQELPRLPRREELVTMRVRAELQGATPADLASAGSVR